MTFASNHHFPRHSHDQFGVGVIAFGAHRSDSLAMEENLLRTLIYIMRQHGTPRRSSSGLSPCVTRALERLDSAPATSVSLAELAALSGVSRFQLLRGFAREVGITPHAYFVSAACAWHGSSWSMVKHPSKQRHRPASRTRAI